MFIGVSMLDSGHNLVISSYGYEENCKEIVIIYMRAR